MPVRYTYAAVRSEIEAFLKDKGRGGGRGASKRLAGALDLDAPGFRHKLIEYRGERFTVEQLGAIADAANAPVGWPFVPWEDGRDLQDAERFVRRAAEKAEKERSK